MMIPSFTIPSSFQESQTSPETDSICNRTSSSLTSLLSLSVDPYFLRPCKGSYSKRKLPRSFLKNVLSSRDDYYKSSSRTTKTTSNNNSSFYTFRCNSRINIYSSTSWCSFTKCSNRSFRNRTCSVTGFKSSLRRLFQQLLGSS
jgi:hypothetical protein